MTDLRTNKKIYSMQKERIIFRVADIILTILTDLPIWLDESYNGFFCDGDPEVTIHAYYNGITKIPFCNKDKVFDSETVWSLHCVDGRGVFLLKLPISGLPYRIAVFDNDFRQGEIYSYPPETDKSLSLFPDPLEYPLAEVLMICLLAQGRGLMIHACGIDDAGRGYLFAGNSTHGKSTMAGLWHDEATILNDDRIVLRWREGRFWMYGTPWHGDYSVVSPNGVPVEKIFFLRHADENSILRKDEISSASMLLTRCFPPLWDADGMRFTLDFCAQIAAEVPCYELGVVPDKNIIDFVRCVK
jgi:hypothetical protein